MQRGKHVIDVSLSALSFGLTKHRREWIDPTWQDELHSYLAGTIQGLGGFPQRVGGMPDHVHLLVGLKATHCLADVLRELKKASTIWVREQQGILDFAWQEGYAAFTVSATARESVSSYITHQAEHHRGKSYREELVELLGRAGVEYDPRYLD